MIPKKIHFCWFGKGDMPQLAKDCIATWHKYMPDWEYKLWNEDNFDISCIPYVKEAYYSKKFAFVSDYVRLYALAKEGGVYMDVDFEVFRSFNELLENHAFAGVEGSKTNPVMMGVIASEPGGDWVTEQLEAYAERHFIMKNGSFDCTTNVRFITDRMIANGYVPDGKEQMYKDLHIYPVDYFCPRLTTGEYLRTGNTFCEHKGLDSWSDHRRKPLILKLVGPYWSIRLIKLKRKLIG